MSQLLLLTSIVWIDKFCSGHIVHTVVFTEELAHIQCAALMVLDLKKPLCSCSEIFITPSPAFRGLLCLTTQLRENIL